MSMLTSNLEGSSDDPWDWSVDQVVREFCRSDQDRPVWCSPTNHLPDSVALEHELRANDITGEVVLTAVSKEVLRDDLNIKSMGQRHTIEKGISYLRSRSQKFRTSPTNAAIIPPFTPVQSWLQVSGPPYDNPSNIGGSVQSGVPLGHTFDSPRLDGQLGTFGSLYPNTLAARGSAQPLAARASPKENPSDEFAANATLDAAPHTIVNGVPAPSSQHHTAVRVRKRIAPTFVAHLDDQACRSGALFGEDDGVTSRDELVDQDLDEREFRYLGAHVADGKRIRASRRIKKYLMSFEHDFRVDRQISSGLNVVGSTNDVKDTTLQKRTVDHTELDEFDYLLDKYPDTQDVLALYGDSGEEGNFDEETWYEIEHDAAEDKNNVHSERALPLLQVDSTIDEVIEKIKSNWQDTKLAKVQAKGFRLWKKVNRENRVQSAIANAQYWIQHLQTSVVKIRQAITRETWPNAGAVRNMCQILEPSISQQQEHRYNISILSRTTAPPRPDRKSVRRANSEPGDLPEGEILLESDSDLSLSNLIDDDNAEPISTSVPPPTTDAPFPFHASEDSDEVISPMLRRQKAKPQVGGVDPRKNPFIEGESSSAEDHSSRAESSSAKDLSRGEDSDLDLQGPLPRSKHEKVGHDIGMPIELMSSSDPPTPDKIRPSDGTGFNLNDDHDLRPRTPTRLTLILHKPPLDDIEAINRMEWDAIENASDNRRALAKAVYSMQSGPALRVRYFVEQYTGDNIRAMLQEGFGAMLDHNHQLQGIAENQRATAKTTTLLFISYCLAKKVLYDKKLDTKKTLKAQGLVDSGGVLFLKELKGIFSNFPQREVMEHGKRTLSNAGISQMNATTSDSESANQQRTTSGRKRRRVKQSLTATSRQRAGQLRVQEQEQRMASMDKKFQNIPRNMMDPASYAIGTEEPIVYLDPKIGGKVKAHQVDGIRFMWRELIIDANKQGCLLAHTMGLGKTMQVISVLVTIAQSFKSPDAGIRKQIPLDLHGLKALILCPPSLIDNWYEEILMWRPDRTVLGEIYKITQRSKIADRVQDIGQWASTGGILIISYDMFRGLIANKAQTGRSAERRPLSDVDHTAVQEHLLNHPNIIVADEAHKMKNSEAGISQVTSRFKSTRRIALTGSPLANNLDEYFAMIDWIAPDYLGSKDQFRSKYAIPIAEGLWNDSDIFDRRTSLRKLHVLKKNLDPKISRADITAIADDLPPKTEFFITVPLTKLQIKAYDLYVTALLGGDEARIAGNARMWDWLAILSLLCNHPSTFLTKLDDRLYGHGKRAPKRKIKTVTTTDDVEGAGLPTDIELADAGLSSEMIEQQRKIFRKVEESGIDDPILSHRSQIVCDIIELAVLAGDKVLLFSHSIPTLNYLEGTISSLGHSTCRLDGGTKVAERQDAVKDFNKESAPYNVFFISTKAGGLGLNLQGANRVILFDYGFNPIWEEQAIGRAYRLGQRKPVFVYRLRAGGTFEEVIYNKAVFKTQLSARVVDKKNPMRYASKKATDYLFPVKDVVQEDLGQYHGKDPSVLDRILSKSNYIRDITLTETFQKEELDESLTAEEAKQADDELKDEQEKRRGPSAYGRKRSEYLSSLVNPRPAASVSTIVRPSLYSQTLATKLPVPGHHQKQQLIVPPIATHQPGGYISRHEAIGNPQQTEAGMWDHRANPHLQNQVEHVLGLPHFDNIYQTPYPSPTAEVRPTEVQKAPGSPSGLGKQLDGAADGEVDESDAGLPQCKVQ
jgi:SNF2 family DNA or RNA helicase